MPSQLLQLVVSLKRMGRWILVVAVVLRLAELAVRARSSPAVTTDPVFFKEPLTKGYRLEPPRVSAQSTDSKADWIRAWPETGSTNFVEFGSRVVLCLQAGVDLQDTIRDRPLQLSRQVSPNTF